MIAVLQRNYVLRLWAFLAFSNRELNLLTFLQRLTAFHVNGTKMDENVALTLAGDKAVTLFVVEPLHGSDNCF